MASVRIKEGESIEVALRRFKRACEKAGITTEVRRRESYEKPTWKRKRKAAAAVKRFQKKMSRGNVLLVRGSAAAAQKAAQKPAPRERH